MMPEIKELLIQEPMVVATSGESVIITNRDNALAEKLDIFADAQLYSPEEDVFSPVIALGSFSKFLDDIEKVEPPQPFVRPT